MGEQDEDLVDLALSLKELNPDSIPLNMLHPASGTPLENENNLTPQRCLKIMNMFCFFHPKRELRAAGGREFNLRPLQPLALHGADCLFALCCRKQQILNSIKGNVPFFGRVVGRRL